MADVAASGLAYVVARNKTSTRIARARKLAFLFFLYLIIKNRTNATTLQIQLEVLHRLKNISPLCDISHNLHCNFVIYRKSLSFVLITSTHAVHYKPDDAQKRADKCINCEMIVNRVHTNSHKSRPHARVWIEHVSNLYDCQLKFYWTTPASECIWMAHLVFMYATSCSWGTSRTSAIFLF